MKKYIIKNRYVSIGLNVEDDIDIESIKFYLGPYVKIDKYNNEILDYTLNFFYNISKLNDFFIDNHFCCCNDKELSIKIESRDEEILFIKRVIIDIINRIFESKGGLFLHASSIVDDGNTTIILGEKGAGKTTNMLYILDSSDMQYSSNERTGIILADGVKTYGNPARINIRANSLAGNQSLRNKLIGCIDYAEYEKQLSLSLPCNCSERLLLSLDDVTRCLKTTINPYGTLKNIINLKKTLRKEFEYEEVQYLDIEPDLRRSIIPGIYPIRYKLNEVIPVYDSSLDILNSNDVHYYNIHHNSHGNNSEEIIKLIRRGY